MLATKPMDVPSVVVGIPAGLNALETTIDVNGSLLISLRDRLEAAGVLAAQPPTTAEAMNDASTCALATHLYGLARRVQTNSDVARDILDRLQL